MDILDRGYYEQEQLWGRSQLSWLEKDRVNRTIRLIPTDTNSILDLGCGDGVITNPLARIFPEVTGVDLSSEALKHVETKTILAGADKIPLPDCSQDLVLLSEVIEHLPSGIYEGCLAETERIARKYILVTVPYREYLRERFVLCPACGCTYHRYRHVRSFDLKDLAGLFPQFTVVKTEFLGGKTVRPYRFEVFLRQNIAGHYNPYALAICPQCGQKGTGDLKRGILSYLLAVIGRVIPRKKSYHWIGVVYQRKKTETRKDGD
jgi:SAM-dependent methyltransferase